MVRLPCVLAAVFALLLVTFPAWVGAQAPPAPKPPAASIDRSGIVLVEQAGRVIALGTILSEDGRIVTALSRVKASGQGPLFVRYANGTLELSRIGHSDGERDLALLVPKTARLRQGIRASRAARPMPGAALSGFAAAANRTVVRTEHTVQSTPEVAGKSVLALAPAPKPADLGAPLLDAHGDAVAIAVSGCLAPATASPCSADPIGMPVPEVRAFLRTVPPEAKLQVPWLGIDGVSADTGTVRGIRVGRVDEKSPAAALGLRVSTETEPGDLLVAVGGVPVPTPDHLQRVLSGRAAGERVELLVYGKDGYRTYSARLTQRPNAAGP